MALRSGRACAALAAGGVFVLGAGDLCDGIVADHAVHVAAADEEAVLRLAEPLEVLAVGVAWLGQHADLIALGFQQTADDGSAKAGVVHIGIAAHHHKVQLLPPAGLHIGPADGKKFGVDLRGRVVHLLISSFLVEHGRVLFYFYSSGWFICISSHCWRLISTARGLAPS